jgi:hypothetical protein
MKQEITYQSVGPGGVLTARRRTFTATSVWQMEQRVSAFIASNAAVIAGVQMEPIEERPLKLRTDRKAAKRFRDKPDADLVRCAGCGRDVEPEGRVGRQGMYSVCPGCGVELE